MVRLRLLRAACSKDGSGPHRCCKRISHGQPGSRSSNGSGRDGLIRVHIRAIAPGSGFWWMRAQAEVLLNASQRAARQLAGGMAIPAALGLTPAAAEHWQNYLEDVRSGNFSWRDVLLLAACGPGEQFLCRPVRLNGGGVAVMAERLEGDWATEAAAPVCGCFGFAAAGLRPLKGRSSRRRQGGGQG